jgi:hypothetical protein
MVIVVFGTGVIFGVGLVITMVLQTRSISAQSNPSGCIIILGVLVSVICLTLNALMWSIIAG